MDSSDSSESRILDLPFRVDALCCFLGLCFVAWVPEANTEGVEATRRLCPAALTT